MQAADLLHVGAAALQALQHQRGKPLQVARQLSGHQRLAQRAEHELVAREELR